MKYRKGNVGKIIAARFDHGDDIFESLREICRREGLTSGWFMLFGALTKGDLVLGPRDGSLPPDPVRKKIDAPHEVIATGTVAWSEGEPSIHVHASLGSKDGVLAGCIREEGKVFIVVECIIFELENINLTRAFDSVTGLNLLDF